ncbi:hypothetical protein [Bradyrhizobium cenepequi]|uniref:hypothetical protein n=1 Tax=Bradyrhizobium cenepequi TaxID=2821403 RepID=UPI001CE2C68A|nr:hypothetical protein [Bradyrhizobium cenepequi]MCA6112303.1 hypothetical protein [Bradyrhizobium cenepequi]
MLQAIRRQVEISMRAGERGVQHQGGVSADLNCEAYSHAFEIKKEIFRALGPCRTFAKHGVPMGAARHAGVARPAGGIMQAVHHTVSRVHLGNY